MKFNVDVDLSTTTEVKFLLKKYKDVFAWSYKGFKGTPPHTIQHQIELEWISNES
jgi:hypothetical protein